MQIKIWSQYLLSFAMLEVISDNFPIYTLKDSLKEPNLFKIGLSDA